VRSLATFMQPRRIPYPCCAPSCSAASPGARRPEALAQGISGHEVVPRNKRIAAQGHFQAREESHTMMAESGCSCEGNSHAIS
jgi:hypothetical protein